MSTFIQYVIPIVLGITIGLIFLALKDYYTAKITGLKDDVFKHSMRKGQLIDVRPLKAYEDDHIKGSRHFTYRQMIQKNQMKIRKDLPVYLVHSSVFKAKRIARKLNLNGYQDVFYLKAAYPHK